MPYPLRTPSARGWTGRSVSSASKARRQRWIPLACACARHCGALPAGCRRRRFRSQSMPSNQSPNPQRGVKRIRSARSPTKALDLSWVLDGFNLVCLLNST
ncbi:unnamed protein product [Urochloa humidicola]